MDYDVSKAFKRIENDLIKSMMRNLDKHRAEETAEGINWSQWQAEQLKDLERYRKENAKRFPEQFAEINKKIDELYRQTAHDAQLKEEEKILEQVKKGKFKPPEDSVSFFGVNDNKLTALIESTHADFIRAEYAVLRQANDQYRKIIFDAQMYASTGVGYKEATNIAVKDLIKAGVADEELKRVGITYEQAIDMSTKELLKAGIRPVVYKNGSRHALSDYAEMAIRTGQKRAYLMGEGNAHDKYGIHTVMVKKRPNACPLCLPFGGKVLVDDVYGGGTAQEARELKVPTLSEAIAQGFLHPNCKDIYSLYIEGVSRPAERWKKEEVDDIVDNYNQEQELNHARDMEESYSRMAEYSLDPTNKQTYEARAKQWSDRVDELESSTSIEEPKDEKRVDYSERRKLRLENQDRPTVQTPFIDTKGANADIVDRTTNVLSEFEKKFGYIDGLQVQFGGITDSSYAQYDPNTKTLHIRRKSNIADLEERMRQDNIRYKLKWKTDLPYYASETFEGSIWHELGHAIDDANGWKFSKALANSEELEIKAKSISAYARTRGDLRLPRTAEAFAENFSVFMTGETEVPEEIGDMIREYLKRAKR